MSQQDINQTEITKLLISSQRKLVEGEIGNGRPSYQAG